MKKLVAILVMLLLVVQTVQFAISQPSDVTNCFISLDEDIETKESFSKKLQKEYPFYWSTAESFLLSTNALYLIYQSFIPLYPSLQDPAPPPDYSC